MKKNINYFFYVFIIIVFIGINILFFFIINGQSKHNRLYMQYVVESMISELTIAIKDDNLEEFLQQNDEITALAIYNSTGIPYLRYGDTPEKLQTDINLVKYGPELKQSQNRIVTIRPFGMMPLSAMHNMRKMMGARRPQAMQFIYLEMKTVPYAFGTIKPGIISIFIFLLTGAVIVFVIFLYQKNEKYRELHEKQVQLVQLGEASRTIAHEIKNPLTSIKIQTSLLKGRLSENERDEINIINEESDRIKDISDKIRDFLGDPAGNPDYINPDEFIKNLISRIEYNIIYENLLEKEISVKIDYERFRSILTNIINNAMESSDEPKPIQITLNKEKGMAVISVKDEGKGIDKKHMKILYDPFFTTKIHGLGLGLSLVKKYMEAAGGKISVDSTINQGTRFELFLNIYE